MVHLGNIKIKLLLFLIFFVFTLTGCSSSLDDTDFKSAKEVASTTAKPESDDNSDDESLEKRSKKGSKKLKETSKDEYDYAMDKYATDNDEPIDIIDGSTWGFYNIYTWCKEYAAPVCLVSVVVGGLIVFFVRGNKRVQKWALYSLIIGVPVLMIFVVYGLGILINLFIGK